MAIEYTLYVDNDSSPLQLQEIICASTMNEPNVTPTGWPAFSGAALQGVMSVPDPVTQQFVNEDFSFRPRAQVTFRLDKFNLEEAQDDLIRCISALVRAVVGDMLLLFNGELVVLQRRADELVLREGFGIWTPKRLSLFDTKFRIGRVEDPEFN